MTNNTKNLTVIVVLKGNVDMVSIIPNITKGVDKKATYSVRISCTAHSEVFDMTGCSLKALIASLKSKVILKGCSLPKPRQNSDSSPNQVKK